MSDVRISRHGTALVITVDRPERANALRRETIRDVIDELEAIKDQPAHHAVQGIVITGAKGRFSGGADLNELNGTIDDLEFDDLLQELTGRIVHFPMPVVAAVEGACFGAAIDLAWACDAVVISTSARVALPATKLRLLYNPATLVRLHTRLGSTMLRRLIVLGEEISGREIAGDSRGDRSAEPGTALDEAVKLLDNATGIAAATEATKALLASLDSGAVDVSVWQTIRQDLLSAPERQQALKAQRQ